jgi:hypothetical protein
MANSRTKVECVGLGASFGFVASFLLALVTQFGGGGDPGEPSGFAFLWTMLFVAPVLAGFGAAVGWLAYRFAARER